VISNACRLMLNSVSEKIPKHLTARDEECYAAGVPGWVGRAEMKALFSNARI